jgi:MFS family permease
MLIGAATIITGTCVQAPATSQGMFIGGRFILGFGGSPPNLFTSVRRLTYGLYLVAICATAGPSYVAEMAHPAWRGTLTGLYNTFWFVGGIPATWTVYGTQGLRGELSWRLPIWLQAVAAGGVLLGCLFCPETPRWVSVKFLSALSPS